MKCPYCKADNNYTYCGKTDVKTHDYIRYRTCAACGQNFKTTEHVYTDLEVKEHVSRQLSKPRKRR